MVAVGKLVAYLSALIVFILVTFFFVGNMSDGGSLLSGLVDAQLNDTQSLQRTGLTQSQIIQQSQILQRQFVAWDTRVSEGTICRESLRKTFGDPSGFDVSIEISDAQLVAVYGNAIQADRWHVFTNVQRIIVLDDSAQVLRDFPLEDTLRIVSEESRGGLILAQTSRKNVRRQTFDLDFTFSSIFTLFKDQEFVPTFGDRTLHKDRFWDEVFRVDNHLIFVETNRWGWFRGTDQSYFDENIKNIPECR